MIHKLAAQLCVAKSKADAGGLPFWRQIFEMAYLFVRNGLGPGYYLMARFWRRDLPLSTKRQHWNGRRYLRFVHKINDPRYYKVSQNKLVEKSLLATLGLPTSKLLGLYHPKAGQGVDGEPLCNATDLERVLATSTADGLFFKPAEGDSGRGVFGLAVVNEAGRRVLREVLTHEEVALAVLAQRSRCRARGIRDRRDDSAAPCASKHQSQLGEYPSHLGCERQFGCACSRCFFARRSCGKSSGQYRCGGVGLRNRSRFWRDSRGVGSHAFPA